MYGFKRFYCTAKPHLKAALIGAFCIHVYYILSTIAASKMFPALADNLFQYLVVTLEGFTVQNSTALNYRKLKK